MKTFKQNANDNRKIMVVAPIENSNDLLNYCTCLITKTIRQLEDNKIDIKIDKVHLYALITTTYKLNKQEESVLLDALSYMGYK